MEDLKDFKISGKKITNVEKAFLTEKGLKWCSKCKSAKSFDSFVKSNQTADGLDGTCRECNKQKRLINIDVRKAKDKEYYESNREIKIKQAAEYRKNNPDKILEMRKKYYESNKDIILQRNAEYRSGNIESISKRQHEYYQENIEEKHLYHKKYRSENLEKSASYLRNRYNTDLNFRLRTVCREMVRRMFDAVDETKCGTTSEALGYTPKQLKEHIEKQFKPGMTWDNYGEWHIDHIIPISSANSLAEGLYLSRLDNLQPLWAEENLTKGSKVLIDLE